MRKNDKPIPTKRPIKILPHDKLQHARGGGDPNPAPDFVTAEVT